MATVFPLARPTAPGDEEIVFGVDGVGGLLPGIQSLIADKLALIPKPSSFYAPAPGVTPGAFALLQGAVCAPGGEGGTPAHVWAVTRKSTPSFRLLFSQGEVFPDPIVPPGADPEADEIAAEAFRVPIAAALEALGGNTYTHSLIGSSAGAICRVLASGRGRGWNSNFAPNGSVTFKR